MFIIRYQAEEFLKLGDGENPKPSRTVKRWTKPAEDVLKINSDRAFDPVTKKGGWGFVIQNSECEEPAQIDPA